MGKIIDLGFAKADDPIYPGGPRVSFRPRLTPSGSATPSNTAGAPQPGKKPPAPPMSDLEKSETKESVAQRMTRMTLAQMRKRYDDLM